jgi:Fe-S cluster biogenesis protein NfuA
MSDPDGPRVAARIETLLREVGGIADPHVSDKVQELVRLVLELYGAGLARVLEIVATQEGAATFVDRLGSDPLVGSLLVLHGLHPLDAETRVRRALEALVASVGVKGGGVTLLGLEDGVARLRLDGAWRGRSSAMATMRTALERALGEAAPEITRIEMEGETAAAPPLIQIQRRAGAARGEGTWAKPRM